MEKINYSDLELKTTSQVETFQVGEKTIEVLQYLPVEDKYSLINITMQKAKEGNIYNPVKLDIFFHLNLVYLYTNLDFTDEEREDEFKLYDELSSNGIIDSVIEKMSEDEYSNLYGYLETSIKDVLEYKNTLAGTIRDVVEGIPERVEEMQNVLQNFDQEKYGNIMSFITAANGGQSIN